MPSRPAARAKWLTDHLEAALVAHPTLAKAKLGIAIVTVPSEVPVIGTTFTELVVGEGCEMVSLVFATGEMSVSATLTVPEDHGTVTVTSTDVADASLAAGQFSRHVGSIVHPTPRPTRPVTVPLLAL